MEFYAKSLEKELTEHEKTKLNNTLSQFLSNRNNEFTEKEIAVLQNAVKKAGESKTNHQKTLKEHLAEIVQCGEEFFEIYGTYFTATERELVLLACRLHDLGKVNDIFQELITGSKRKNISQIPHGFLSCYAFSKKWFLETYPEMEPEDFKVLITAVYYHHTRKVNDFHENEAQWLEEYCSKYYLSNLEQFLGISIPRLYYTNKNKRLFQYGESSNSQMNTEVIAEEVWRKYLTVKGLLNKFDWTVSAGHEKAEFDQVTQGVPLQEKLEKVLGGHLRPGQLYMKDHVDNNVIMVAPTGSGKTEAALLWINGAKGFYTLPLKVSSNAIYDRILKKYEYESVALVHSDSMQKYLTEHEESGYERYELAKLFSYPLTVCTVDQLFKFVYKALGTEIAPATLRYSKIVIDEIQAYEPRIVAALIYGLSMIQKMGGKFAIITATFPPVLKEFMKKYGLLEGKEYQFTNISKTSQLRRHQIAIREGELDIEVIAAAGKTKKVLVLCNTVSRAQEVYEELSEQSDVSTNLLHSRFTRKHRALLEEKILQFSSKEGGSGIWVSTQIVEASLDIDFDLLYTEMCPCDSLLQRMGRCNRAGRYIPNTPNVFVFVTERGGGKIYDNQLYCLSVQYLYEYMGMIFTEDLKNQYINKVYEPDQIRTTTYYKNIERYLAIFAELNPMEYEKKDADQEFRNINSITVLPDRIYEEHKGALDACLTFLGTPHIGKEVRALLNEKISSYTLNLNVYGKFPINVDYATISGTTIHRSCLKYDFDAEKCRGRGLVLGKVEDESFCL